MVYLFKTKRNYVHEVGQDQNGGIIEIKRDEQGNIVETKPFDALIYSQMKHGSPEAIKIAARELFERIIKDNQLIQNFLDYKVVITNSSRTVPTSSFLIMRVLVEDFLNPYLEQKGADKIGWVRSDRASWISTGDYGTLSKAEREARMARRKAFFSPENKKKLEGKKVILFDDLVATGAYEKNQAELLKRVGVKGKNIIYLYWIQVERRTADKHPEFEAKLNYVSIRELNDLLNFFYDPRLIINARTLKYILPIKKDDGSIDQVKKRNLRDFFSKLGEVPGDLRRQNLGRKTLLKIYEAASSSDGYSERDRFKDGFQLLENYMVEIGIHPERNA
jgi:hypothetical protein